MARSVSGATVLTWQSRFRAFSGIRKSVYSMVMVALVGVFLGGLMAGRTKPKPHHQLDLHVGLGLSSAAVDHYIGVGYSFRFRAVRR